MSRSASAESAPLRGPARALFALACVLAILVATLWPGDSRVPPFTVCIVCGTQGIADAVSNIALFVPLGASLVLLGLRPTRAVLLAAALSAFVEGMQATVVPGRDPSLGDVTFNTLGAFAGVLAGRTAHVWVAPSRRMARSLAFAAALAAGAAVAATGYLLGPSLQGGLWYGQWTARFGGMERYRGRLLEARLDGRVLPSTRLETSDSTRQALLDGAPLDLSVLAGLPTRRLSPIFSLADDRGTRQFLLGATGAALELYVRRRAGDALLVNPPLRFEAALAGVSPGDTLALEVHRSGARWCAGRAEHAPCVGFSAGAGWQLLQNIGLLRRHAPLLNALWLFGLLFPAGYWVRGRLTVPLGVSAVSIACAITPLACGLVISPPAEWTGAAGGFAAGQLLAAFMRRRSSAEGRKPGAAAHRGGVTA